MQRERERAAQDQGFPLVRRDHQRTKAALVFLVHKRSLSQPLRNCFRKKKKKKIHLLAKACCSEVWLPFAFGSCLPTWSRL